MSGFQRRADHILKAFHVFLEDFCLDEAVVNRQEECQGWQQA